MHPDLVAILASIEQDRQALYASVEALTDEQLERRPDAETWSVGDVLRHLQLTETSIARLMAKSIARVEQEGMPELDGMVDAAAVEAWLEKVADRAGAKRTSPDSLRPTGRLPKAELIAMLRRSRTELLAVLPRASDEVLRATRFPHPAIGPLTMYEWLRFVGLHERRHLAQIVETMQQLGLHHARRDG